MSKAPGRLVRLESIRGFAAALVLLNHTRLLSGGPPGGVLGALGSLGQEAVILFFVLSGFVIHYASFGKTSFASAEPLRFRKYFIHRFRRIYPLLFISLALAYAVTCLGAGHRVPADWKTLGGNLIMLQDVGALKRGVWFEPYCGNLALWSLSYEWWFYMLFFAIATWMASRPETQKYCVAAISLLGFVTYQLHPNQISLILGYFFIWWTGVELSQEFSTTGRITWQHQSRSLFLLTGLALLWFTPVALAKMHHQPLRLGIDPVLQFRHFSVALFFLVVGIAWYKRGFPGFNKTVGCFTLLAPITYAAYIIHIPVYQAVAIVLPSLPRSLQFPIALAVLIPACYLLEVKLQRHINRWFSRLEGPGKLNLATIPADQKA